MGFAFTKPDLGFRFTEVHGGPLPAPIAGDARKTWLLTPEVTSPLREEGSGPGLAGSLLLPHGLLSGDSRCHITETPEARVP